MSMRLIASPAYRAFPELDSFTDEQCREFVHLSRGSSFRCALVLLLRAVLAAGCAGITISALLDHTAAPAELAAAAALVLGGAAWLLAGDVALRIGMRRVMRRGGACPACGYVLVGLPVDAMRGITCPECGHRADVRGHDSSVVTGGDGVERFLPSTAVVFERPRRQWRAAARRTWSWGRWALVGALLLAATTIGIRELLLRSDAARAQADLAALPTVEDLMERFRAAWPKATADGDRAFEVLAEFDRCIAEALPGERLVPLSVPPATWAGRAPPRGSADDLEERAQDAARRAELLPPLLQAGAWELAVRVARAPVVDPGPLGADDLPGGWPDAAPMAYPIDRPFRARPAAYESLGRLHHLGAHVAADAANRGDHDRLAEACEVMHAAVRLRRAVRMAPFDGATHVIPLCADVIASIRAPGGADRLARLLECASRFDRERPDPVVVDDIMVALVWRDIAEAFVDPEPLRWGWRQRTAKARSRALLFLTNPTLVRRPLPLTPNYRAEREQVDAVVRSAMRTGRGTEDGISSIDPVGAPLLAVVSASVESSAVMNRWLALQRAAWGAMLAIEGHRIRYGRLPDSLEALVPEFLPEAPRPESVEAGRVPAVRMLRLRLVPEDPRGIGYELWPSGSGPGSVAGSADAPLIPRY